ncbi:histidine triad nucleotide-binding protein [bacterium]|nr:histidine triad nucleotide-binding protein [bacterium]
MSNDTIFHKIIRKEIPTEIIFEDDQVIVIKDISPQAPIHLLGIPKESIASMREARPENSNVLGQLLIRLSEIATKLGLNDRGYRLVINSGPDAQQTVFQLHVHLLAGREFTWPPG